jgi:hypothetical protein
MRLCRARSFVECVYIYPCDRDKPAEAHVHGLKDMLVLPEGDERRHGVRMLLTSQSRQHGVGYGRCWVDPRMGPDDGNVCDGSEIYRIRVPSNF